MCAGEVRKVILAYSRQAWCFTRLLNHISVLFLVFFFPCGENALTQRLKQKNLSRTSELLEIFFKTFTLKIVRMYLRKSLLLY